MFDLTGVIAILSIFVFIPSLVVGGILANQWFKLRNNEIELRREQLAVERKRLEFLDAEAQREAVARLEREL